jgi:hypothetical protein
MRHEESVHNQVEHTPSASRKGSAKQTRPADGGSQLQFKILITIIGVGVLLRLLRVMGVT